MMVVNAFFAGRLDLTLWIQIAYCWKYLRTSGPNVIQILGSLGYVTGGQGIQEVSEEVFAFQGDTTLECTPKTIRIVYGGWS